MFYGWRPPMKPPQMEASRINLDPEKLAEQHWNYVESVIRAEWNAMVACGFDASNLETHLDLIGYHYKSAFIHGYKHGLNK